MNQETKDAAHKWFDLYLKIVWGIVITFWMINSADEFKRKFLQPPNGEHLKVAQSDNRF
jgi:hypothetical protein